MPAKVGQLLRVSIIAATAGHMPGSEAEGSRGRQSEEEGSRGKQREAARQSEAEGTRGKHREAEGSRAKQREAE